MNRDGLRMPGGLIVTQEIEQFIRTLVAPFRYTQDFDDLPIPFRAVATDMVAGEVVILDSGDLSEAMRASMALPGVFSPVTLDGKVLSDGGMMRNLPVDIGRELCADVVIAVWMSSPPTEADGPHVGAEPHRAFHRRHDRRERAPADRELDAARRRDRRADGRHRDERLHAHPGSRRARPPRRGRHARAAQPLLGSGGRVPRLGRQSPAGRRLPRRSSPRSESSARSA